MVYLLENFHETLKIKESDFSEEIKFYYNYDYIFRNCAY